MSTATAWTRSSPAPDPCGGPHVRVLKVSGGTVTELASFYAYDPAFTGGVFVACGDVTGDGVAEIITGAGPGGGPHVRAFSLAGGVVDGGRELLRLRPGVHGRRDVAAADLTGDGVAEIITGAGPGGGPHVRAFSLAGGIVTEVASFFAYDPAFPGGVHVAAGGRDRRRRGRDHHRGRARRRAARARLQPGGRRADGGRELLRLRPGVPGRRRRGGRRT